MNVAVVGAAGYAGEQLVRLILGHPHARLVAVTSRRLAGKPLAEVVPGLRGADQGITFTASEPAELAARDDLETVFLALPHGVAAEYALALVNAGKRVIDLSADFRLRSAARYKEFYGHDHPAPELLGEARYVIPEVAAPGWESARLIAAPGCYPTSILAPLIPLVRAGVLSGSDIIINSLSGVSGAGRKAAEMYLFCERAESAVAYGAPKHRHLSEIEEQLTTAAGREVIVQFTPHLVPMRRGILSTIVAPADGRSLADLYAAWNATFSGRPHVAVLPSGTFPDSAHVVGTNRIDISAVHDPRTNRFVITTAEDNLIKGAGGQAVQILNLIAGWNERAGLS